MLFAEMLPRCSRLLLLECSAALSMHELPCASCVLMHNVQCTSYLAGFADQPDVSWFRQSPLDCPKKHALAGITAPEQRS